MPRPDQRSVTLPKWVVDLANEYYKTHKEELARIGIKSTTGLITHWMKESLRGKDALK